MAETIPGGKYRRPDGSFVDAHGNVLEGAPTAPPTEPAAPEAPSARWNKAQLTEYALERGLTISEDATKAEILAVIESAQAAPPANEGDAGGDDQQGDPEVQDPE